MAYDLKKLNVASLDFTDIKDSLINFYKQQEDIGDLDYDNPASAINMLINILATATAYNGIYAQYGYLNSFSTTATTLNGLLGIASNSSILLEPTKTAACTRTLTVAGTTLESYTAFTAITTKGSQVYFYNKESINSNSSKSIKLYSGNVVVYTEYDYTTNSIEIPYTIDPETITFKVTDTNTNTTETWTEVSNISKISSSNNKHYCVINGNLGYILTTNIPTAKNITTQYKVTITAIQSNGSSANSATINAPSYVSFGTSELPSGGYDLISVAQAKTKLKFKASSTERCVTIADYKNAILNSGISGTDDITKISVTSSLLGEVKVYVTGLGTSLQNQLLLYLSDKTPAGISVKYSL
jgi:hypothetical protein